MTDVGDIDDVKSPEAMMTVMSSSSPREELPSSTGAAVVSQSGEVDSWIAILSKCKQLPEEDVKRLCDKVSSYDNVVNAGPRNITRRIQCPARTVSRDRVR